MNGFACMALSRRAYVDTGRTIATVTPKVARLPILAASRTRSAQVIRIAFRSQDAESTRQRARIKEQVAHDLVTSCLVLSLLSQKRWHVSTEMTGEGMDDMEVIDFIWIG